MKVSHFKSQVASHLVRGPERQPPYFMNSLRSTPLSSDILSREAARQQMETHYSTSSCLVACDDWSQCDRNIWFEMCQQVRPPAPSSPSERGPE